MGYPYKISFSGIRCRSYLTNGYCVIPKPFCSPFSLFTPFYWPLSQYTLALLANHLLKKARTFLPITKQKKPSQLETIPSSSNLNHKPLTEPFVAIPSQVESLNALPILITDSAPIEGLLLTQGVTHPPCL